MAWLRSRVGFRGSFLLLLALFDVFYGYYLVIGGALEFRLLITERTWGVIWLSVAAVLAAGAFAREDRWHYALATALKIAWAAEFFRLNLLYGSLQWTRGVYFLALGLIVVLASAWPEPRREPE